MPGFFKKFVARLRGKKLAEDKAKKDESAPPKSADAPAPAPSTEPAPESAPEASAPPESAASGNKAQEPTFSILPHPAVRTLSVVLYSKIDLTLSLSLFLCFGC